MFFLNCHNWGESKDKPSYTVSFFVPGCMQLPPNEKRGTRETEHSGCSHRWDNHPTDLFYLPSPHGRASVPSSSHYAQDVLCWCKREANRKAVTLSCRIAPTCAACVLTRSFRRQIYPAVNQRLTPCPSVTPCLSLCCFTAAVVGVSPRRFLKNRKG